MCWDRVHASASVRVDKTKAAGNNGCLSVFNDFLVNTDGDCVRCVLMIE